ncbi:MAG: 2-oxo acid dehydrogenase subunit E2 [Chloroflexi bacterium]|nr:2-oxo acid dehydrogenase subunit E2 [Chloroflexota bacterium]
MARPIVMPSLGMYTTEGTLAAWLRPPGARVEAGEPIAEITTEKTTHQIEAPVAGVLHPVAEVGANLSVEALIGYVLAAGEEPPAHPAGLPSPASASGTSQLSTQHSVPPEPPRPSTEVRASPVARRLAAQHGIDLTQLRGSGPGGRIVEADVLEAVARLAAAPSSPVRPERRVRQRVSLTGMRRIIAERLRHSLATAASVTLTREVDAETLVAARGQLAERIGSAPPYDALFVKLFATALRERPELNATVENDEIVVFDEVNVGFAVAVPDGLVVPVIRTADRQSLATVAAAVRELSDRARSGRLRPSDVDGGTATITNLGAYGVDAFTPILNASNPPNPPQSVILGIGRIQARPVVRDGLVIVRHTCVLSLTFDHRVADGVPAAQLLDAVARLMADERYLASLA